ncbi:MAG TPA: hypothetical protein VLG27_00080 [Candidatus Saccharimonadia bacterium]|nr:hypothetical protein [Candidatus Saccharimonadia bacterium]
MNETATQNDLSTRNSALAIQDDVIASELHPKTAPEDAQLVIEAFRMKRQFRQLRALPETTNPEPKLLTEAAASAKAAAPETPQRKLKLPG